MSIVVETKDQLPADVSTPEYHYAIVEQPTIGPQERSYWARYALPRLALMSQEEFAHLREEGPWLVALGEQPDIEFTRLQQDLGKTAIHGHLTSYLPLAELAQHLSDALLAQDNNGKTVLLRSYVPHVLSVLHAHSEHPWQSWLFGPINRWTVYDSAHGPVSFSGGGLKSLPDYTPIELDSALIQELGADPQASALLKTLLEQAPEVFTSADHDERLKQVEGALDGARKSGLKHPDDISLFATIHLLEGKPPNEDPIWPEAMRLVEEQHYELGRALETVLEARSE
ncbi:DUF4123 domain-containing protein [Pseudomonas sp. NPDC098747]|uniref:DUF4123 domain-containing protein n=1 Tax=Pseudomonas sp. NPDC098747 TaxID=3364487 RepID=UPI003839F775